MRGSFERACVSALVCACVCGFSVVKKKRRKKWPEVAQAKPLPEIKGSEEEGVKNKVKIQEKSVFVMEIMLPIWIVMVC